jgi:hypothetical protein
MKRLNFFSFIASVLLIQGFGLASQTNGQETATKAKPQTAKAATQEETLPGIAIGETLQAITLKKQDGSDVAIQELLKKGPVAIGFYRSAVW